MNVTLKLYAGLSDYLPSGSRDNRIQITIGEGETVGCVIARHHLPEKLVHLVLVNGVFIPPEIRAAHALKSGDHLAIWPPIAGG
jgi:sulfur carrier protein ThiS